MKDLEGKVALVTGSSRGIGAATAKLFARYGAKVVLHGRDQEQLARTAHDIEREGGIAMTAFANIVTFTEIEAMRRDIESRFGPVQILIANAGGSFTPPGPLEEIPEEGWRASIDGNLTATFLTMKSFIPSMKALHKGAIVTMSSSAGHNAHSMAPIPYSAAKAGIEIMTRDLAAQLGPYGIRVNCIAPETILTERNLERIPSDHRDRLAGYHPLRRLGTPEDIAEAALYLASDRSSWITGIVMEIDGGSAVS